MDRYVFFTHGFSLSNFSDDFILVDNKFVNNENTVVSSLDLFTFVLVKTGKNIPCSIHTEEWISSLEDYSRNLFRGCDFWRLKAEYILTFFASVNEYNCFAQNNFYANFIQKAPDNEYPFLGEIKIAQSINSQQIILPN